MVTSVLSHQRLSDTQVGEIYRKRWGLEIFYRDFKQTLGKRKLLSRTPEHARIELHWSLLSLALLLLKTRLHQQHLATPIKTSVSNVLRVMRRALRGCYQTSRALIRAVRSAVVDRYERKRKSFRTYPQRRTRKPPGPPTIKPPSADLNLLAQKITPLTLTSYG
ncbi:Transposase DDE domain protein [Thalassoglobus neptunius]|uniref:Transposase DDE domain protein n=1 Tax=Thalassoglobus neptunius TaxID=1938619 RepID=A0A5C5WZG1_9PLAN|nr:Transposase DDE domain protein [Thalassoglobus neptunius]